MAQVVQVLALQEHVDFLCRGHVDLNGGAKDGLVTHAQLQQLRHLHLVPDGVLALAVRLLHPVLMLGQEILQHLLGLHGVCAHIPLASLQLFGHGIEGTVRIPAAHPLQHIHGRQLVQVQELVCHTAGKASGCRLNLPLGIGVDLSKQALHLVVDHIVPVIELGAQTDGSLVQILQGAQIHVSNLSVIQSGHDPLQLLGGQEVRVVLHGVLVHLGQVFPGGIVLITPAHLVGGTHGVQINVAQDFIPGCLQLLRRPVPISAQPLELFQSLLL